MNRNKPYIYAVIYHDKILRWFNGVGWSDYRDKAKIFKTEAEAENVLRKMLKEGLKAKMGYVQ